MKLSEIKNNPNNPKFIKDDKFKKLVENIKSFPKMLKLRPIVIDNDNMILGGNMRFRALKELGYKEIPDEWVKRADELTEDERKKFIILDNNDFGSWDFDSLANEWDYDELADLGLDLPELDVPVELDPEKENEVPESKKEIYSRTGDIFLIDGKHRVMCGDSKKDLTQLMDGGLANLYFTDPPYAVDYSSKNAFLNNVDKGNHIQRDIENDTMGVAETEEFLTEVFKSAFEVLEDDCSFYCCSAQ